MATLYLKNYEKLWSKNYYVLISNFWLADLLTPGTVDCSADGKYEVSYKPNVVIYNTGDVLWIPPAIYKSSCQINVEYFPFDEQNCEMKFGSWTFNGDQVILDWYEEQRKVGSCSIFGILQFLRSERVLFLAFYSF